MMCSCNDEIKFDESYEHFKENMSMSNHHETTLEIEDIDAEIIFSKSQTSTSTSLKCNAKRVKNS